MFLTETLYPGGYTPGYTESLCRRISSSISGIQAGGILTHTPRVNRRFRCPDRGIFDVYRGGDDDAVRAGFQGTPGGCDCHRQPAPAPKRFQPGTAIRSFSGTRVFICRICSGRHRVVKSYVPTTCARAAGPGCAQVSGLADTSIT